MRPEAVTPPPQKEWCPANMAAVFGLFMGSVAICNVSSLQVLRCFFASSLLELCVAREVWSHWGIWAAKMVTKNAAGGVFAEGPPSYLAKVSARNLFLPAFGATRRILGAILDPAGFQGGSKNHVFGYHVGKITKKGCPKTRPEKTSKFD